ncbi:50S ribosomal protein L19 [Wolbachia endosymbiont of Dirofilaria (Dirofilaria) immitis]|uniref:50S ribosomal protein L19 n=1 Tax=Wolbachia endosymbiont of Dirofilaria (Dirofilaria) immitis TaxID=1812115 RepID=UPI00158AB13A|nr:50S ribosomal protein L19 [Wolbachia endosymbiont of Dirofilaria (Dirofilaria) immitis]QKX02600.1 50S ribosomal protein L19 [Wolbachia endosymbiont of Dirofilaria (Dirofilaria) immitis]
MVNLLEKFNKKQMEVLIKEVPEFRPGDDLKVTFRMVDGASERIQVFEGVCVSKRNRGLHSSFAVRKVSYGESIVSQFFVYSPALISVQVTRKGKVRRAKLYYLCKLFGKAARIKERTTYKSDGSK